MIFNRLPITSKKKQKNLSASTPDKKINTVTSTKTKGSIFFQRVSVTSEKNNTGQIISVPIDKDKSVIPVKTNKSIFFKRVSTSKKETSKMPKKQKPKKQPHTKREGLFFKKSKTKKEPLNVSDVDISDNEVHSMFSQEAEDFLLTAAKDTRGLKGPDSAGMFSKKTFNAETLRSSYTPITTGFILFTFSIAFFFIAQIYFINPMLDEQSKLILAKTEFKNGIMKYRSQNPELKKNITAFNAFVKTIKNKFYPINGVDEFFGMVSRASLNHNLKMEFTKGDERSYKREGKEEIVFNVVPVQLNLEGGYIDYLRFHDVLVNSPKYVRFEKEQITNDSDVIRIVVNLSVALNNA